MLLPTVHVAAEVGEGLVKTHLLPGTNVVEVQSSTPTAFQKVDHKLQTTDFFKGKV